VPSRRCGDDTIYRQLMPAVCTTFLNDGRIDIDNNALEPSTRKMALQQ
jgi:hypothetical protein